jgi:hypothetical protein
LKLQTDFKYQKEFGNKKIETNFGKKREKPSLPSLGHNPTSLSSLLSLAQPKRPNSSPNQPSLFPRGFFAKPPSSPPFQAGRWRMRGRPMAPAARIDAAARRRR